MDPLLPNPGGQLALDEIVGREREIKRYWRVLDRQSLVLSAERRIGKTQLVKKMHGIPREGFVTVYQDLERVHTRMELVASIYEAARDHLNASAKVREKLLAFWQGYVPKKISATELPEAKAQWKDHLCKAIDEVLNAIPADHKLLLIWDELPLMVDNIQRGEEADAAIQLLDLLRALRATRPRLRFIFTGSIGLHLVLRALRAAGNANAPTNDMLSETVPPMSKAEATELAERLLLSLPFPPKDFRELAATLVERVEGFPYYLHHTVNRLSWLDHQPEPSDLAEAIDGLVLADEDPANLAYYRDRLTKHYSSDEARIARAVLNALSHEAQPMQFEALCNLVRHASPEVQDTAVADVCGLLRQDHYLTLEGGASSPRYRYRWAIVKRWWAATQR